MTTIATWNVNSVKVRLPHLIDYLQDPAPDVLLLQELKSLEENFPRLEVEQLGYHAEVVGQKGFNGVAILSKAPIDSPLRALPGDPEDTQARYVEGTTFGLRVASIYLPNGNPIDTEKFPYKLAWIERLRQHAAQLLTSEQPVILGGDYNVIPRDIDVYDPGAFAGDALTQPQTRHAFHALLNLGLTEAFRALHPNEVAYSYWDYQGGAWQHGHGLRIDHFLLSPQAADRLETCDIDKGPRGKAKASDHTPVWCRLREMTQPMAGIVSNAA